jgi:hypothetical protein
VEKVRGRSKGDFRRGVVEEVLVLLGQQLEALQHLSGPRPLPASTSVVMSLLHSGLVK